MGPVRVLFNLIQRRSGVFQHQFVHSPFGAENFLGVDFQFRSSSLHPGQWLMDHDPAVWQREPFSFCPCCQEHGPHAGTLTEAICRHVAADKLHRVVDRHPCGNRSARAVDIHVDVGFAVFELKVQQMSDNAVGNVIIDGASQQDDSVAKQTAVDVHRPLFAAIFFDDVGNQ